jgi:hypothetical protein
MRRGEARFLVDERRTCEQRGLAAHWHRARLHPVRTSPTRPSASGPVRRPGAGGSPYPHQTSAALPPRPPASRTRTPRVVQSRDTTRHRHGSPLREGPRAPHASYVWRPAAWHSAAPSTGLQRPRLTVWCTGSLAPSRPTPVKLCPWFLRFAPGIPRGKAQTGWANLGGEESRGELARRWRRGEEAARRRSVLSRRVVKRASSEASPCIDFGHVCTQSGRARPDRRLGDPSVVPGRGAAPARTMPAPPSWPAA